MSAIVDGLGLILRVAANPAHRGRRNPGDYLRVHSGPDRHHGSGFAAFADFQYGTHQ